MSIIPSASPNDTSPAPLSAEREAEIRTALNAVPAPPWRWIGSRHAGGPQLVTDHSGRQYLLRAAKPTDHRGDELLDPETDAVVYGDLEFRDQREGSTYSTMRSGNSLAVGRTSYDPDAIVGVDNPVARWVEVSAQYAAELLAEVDALRAQVAEMGAQAEKVAAFCAQRAEYVTNLREFVEGGEHDYFRWTGHAEARRQLSQSLGLPVAWPAETEPRATSTDEDSHGEKVAEYLSTPYTDDLPSQREAGAL